MAGYVLPGRTWLNRRRDRAVAEGSNEAASLLGVTGDVIPEEQARRLGLLAVLSDMAPGGDAELRLEPATPIEDDEDVTAEAKMVPAPPEDKAIHADATKAPKPRRQRVRGGH